MQHHWRFVALAGTLALVAGCRRSASPTAPAGSRAAPPTAGGQTLQIKGSDTMVNLGGAWAEAFMKEHPDIPVAVTGGGSGTGIAALINGTTDIAEASRAMKPQEIAQAKARGVYPQEHRVALDAVTVVVNPSNAVRRLTIPQLSDIYTGKTTNWKALGGPGKPIVALSRDRNSGTHVFFLEHVVQQGNPKSGAQYAPGVLMMPSSKAISDEVAGNPQAIGYFGLGYLNPKRHAAVAIAAKPGGEYVSPSAKTVLSGRYPVARPLFLYTHKDPRPAVKTFVDFVLSPEGQKIVGTQEFVPLPPAGASGGRAR